MTIEKTFVMIKPDGVKRQVVGELITRFEKVGYKIVGMKMVQVDADFAKKHYFDVEERHGPKILGDLVEFITSGPVVAMVIEGANAIKNVRKMVGKTEPSGAEPGTIRGDYAHMNYARADSTDRAITNLIHASAAKEDAEHEMHLWFSDAELVSDYKTVHEIFM